MVAFILTMPYRGSWNGKWSGDGDLFARVKYNRSVPKEVIGRNFDYDFGDGWTANVEVKKVDAKEAKRIRKESRGFSTYDWMIESIIKFGSIRPPKEWRDD